LQELFLCLYSTSLCCWSYSSGLRIIYLLQERFLSSKTSSCCRNFSTGL
jgi:hypothetical protein